MSLNTLLSKCDPFNRAFSERLRTSTPDFLKNVKVGSNKIISRIDSQISSVEVGGHVVGESITTSAYRR